MRRARANWRMRPASRLLTVMQEPASEREVAEEGIVADSCTGWRER